MGYSMDGANAAMREFMAMTMVLEEMFYDIDIIEEGLAEGRYNLERKKQREIQLQLLKHFAEMYEGNKR